MVGRAWLLAVAAAVVAACAAPSAQPTADPLAGTYTGFGSPTALDNTKVLTAAFSKLHPAVAFKLSTTDTETAIVKIKAGDRDAQFAFIGRELLPAEVGVTTTPMGATGSAFAVNSANPVRSLTRAQLHDILTGQISNWSAVGGQDLPVKVIVREATSQTRTGLEAYVFGTDAPTYAANTIFTSSASTASAEMLDALRSLSGAIGMVTLNSRILANPSVKLLGLDGREPTSATLANGEWPVRRPIYLVTSPDPQRVPAAIKAFIAFIESPEGKAQLAAQ